MNLTANPDAARGAPAQGDRHAGRLYVVAAPSGAGKTSLVKGLMQREPKLRFSVSYTTRARRPDEVDGRDYHFVSKSQFQEMVARGEFLEHAQVFDNYYGTAWSAVQSAVADGQLLLLEIDWQGARQVRARLPAARSIFILPPTRRALGERLRSRSTDSDMVIERRLKDAASDLGHWQEFDYVVVNDDFDRALEELHAIVQERGDALAATRPEVARLAAGAADLRSLSELSARHGDASSAEVAAGPKPKHSPAPDAPSYSAPRVARPERVLLLWASF